MLDNMRKSDEFSRLPQKLTRLIYILNVLIQSDF